MATREQRRGYYNQYRICLKEASTYKKASREYVNLIKRLTLAKTKLEAIIDYRGSLKVANEACGNLIISGERIDKGMIEEFISGSSSDIKSVKAMEKEIEEIIIEATQKKEENLDMAQTKTADAQHYFNLYRDSN